MRLIACSFMALSLVSFTRGPSCHASYLDDNPERSHELSLADLAGYRAALSGKPTADLARASDPPVEAKFKDLWNQPDAFRGRRVSVRGRVVRIFRQGAVGSFPPLAEVWITSPAGDPFCAVFPQPGPTEPDQLETAASPGGSHGEKERIATVPELGRIVDFTGTFLKLVRYAGSDGPRLAPLIVGDRLPAPVTPNPALDHFDNEAGTNGIGGGKSSATALGLAFWALGLAALGVGAVLLARWHLRMPVRPARAATFSSRSDPDRPLEFIEPRDSP
jgi:hypothetical protein